MLTTSSKIRFRLAFLILVFILSDYTVLNAQDIIINELMSSNSFTIADEDGDYEDWIELFNYGSQPVNLTDWFISDDYENPQLWQLPDITINTGDYLLIWASDKNRTHPNGELHTNFSISSDGEEILLSNPEGELIDELPPTAIPADVSIGRKPGDIEEWFFFDQPTPGSENNTTGYQYILEPPSFSLKPGFYSESKTVEIIHPDSAATIYYTLDGSVPDKNSLVYKEPLILKARSGEQNSHSTIPTNLSTAGVAAWKEPASLTRKANIIRAKAVREGSLNSQSIGGTWFVFQDEVDINSLPVVSVISDSSGWFGYEEGIYVAGQHGDPTNFWLGNYSQRGREWEREASVEIFETSGERVLAQNAGIRIHGGWSRQAPQKSLRMYARNDYGSDFFHYPLFPDQPYDKYKRFILRNSGNDWVNTMFMDATAQSLIRHFNVDTQQYRPAIVFLNGEYWGIHNFRERYDKHYLNRKYGAEEGKIDFLTGKDEVKEGDNYHYQALINFVEQHDLSLEVHMEVVKTLMDIDNFLDYYSAQIYYGNNDWPQNNIDFWRYRTDYNPHAPKGLDGRWRWLLYDVDRSIGYSTQANFDIIAWITADNERRLNNLFLNLIENDPFKHDLINRVADHLNSAFTTQRVTAIIDSLREPLLPEIEEHIDRWGYPPSVTDWNQNVYRMYIYAEQRPYFLRQHLTDHFDLGETVMLSFENLDQPGGTVVLNSMEISIRTPGIKKEDGSWSGIYFENSPVTIKALPKKGYRFSHWSGDVENLSESDQKRSELTLFPVTEQTLIPNFEAAPPVETGEPQLLAYWVFTSDLPNNIPLTVIEPTTVHNDLLLDGLEPKLIYQPSISPYPPIEGTAGILDRVNDPTTINYDPHWNSGISFDESEMRGIRARNPSLVVDTESTILFKLPTTGYKDIEFSFAAKRTGSGQRNLIFEYSTDGFETWIQDNIDPKDVELFEEYAQIALSFEDVPSADNNSDFGIRIKFGGDIEIREGESGNTRFNNISISGVVKEFTSNNSDTDLPSEHILHQNYPNPFNPVTTIDFQLVRATQVQLEVYDMLGRRVASLADGFKNAGSHSVSFDASSISSGVYIYRLQTGSTELYRRMTLIK